MVRSALSALHSLVLAETYERGQLVCGVPVLRREGAAVVGPAYRHRVSRVSSRFPGEHSEPARPLPERPQRRSLFDSMSPRLRVGRCLLMSFLVS